MTAATPRVQVLEAVAAALNRAAWGSNCPDMVTIRVHFAEREDTVATVFVELRHKLDAREKARKGVHS